MPWGAIVGGGLDILGGLFGSGSSDKAAKQYQAAANQANNVLTQQFQTDQSYISPYAQTGGQANNMLALMMSNPQAFQQQFQASPGYSYNLNQQQGAIQNSAAAKGGLTGGNTLMALQNNASGLANQDYQQFITNLMQQQGVGLSAGGTQAQLGQDYATQYGQNLLGAAMGNSAATIQGNNAMFKGIGGAASLLGSVPASGWQSAGKFIAGLV